MLFCEELDRELDLISVQILLKKMHVSVPDGDRPLELCSVELEATAGQEQMEVETALEPEKAPSPPPPPPVPPGELHILDIALNFKTQKAYLAVQYFRDGEDRFSSLF